ncbi:hypothetical protein ACP3TJ_04295 [Desulforudis sp. 1088]|uniref:hypothetical protein n=1 Tax=Desulforudis sp. 1031 TaxID=3416138 RepID=UPI003CF876D2
MRKHLLIAVIGLTAIILQPLVAHVQDLHFAPPLPPRYRSAEPSARQNTNLFIVLLNGLNTACDGSPCGIWDSALSAKAWRTAAQEALSAILGISGTGKAPGRGINRGYKRAS